jgi:hypothetical protein
MDISNIVGGLTDNIKVRKVSPNFINAQEIAAEYKLAVPFVLKMMKEYGGEWVYQCFLESKKISGYNSAGLFINKVHSIKLV